MPTIYLDSDMSEAVIHELGNGDAAVFSARCPGKDSPNEDAAALLSRGEDACVLVVADGMGGERAGHEAAACAVRAMRLAIGEADREGWMLRTAIMNGIERANQAVLELGVGAGSTLAVVEVQNEEVRPYHVGDSTILLVGQRGKVKLQTVAHSPVGFAVESGMLKESEAMHHEDRHLVSNMLGAPDMRIEVGSSRRLAPHDTLLIASDGLSDNLETGEIVERIRTGPLGRVAERLVGLARQRMDQSDNGKPSKPDDLTFVGFRRRL